MGGDVIKIIFCSLHNSHRQVNDSEAINSFVLVEEFGRHIMHNEHFISAHNPSTKGVSCNMIVEQHAIY